MSDAATAVLAVFSVLYILARVLVHRRACRRQRPGRVVSGQADKLAFLILFGALLALIVQRWTHPRGAIATLVGVLFLVAALGLRIAALRRLAHFYSEAIVLFEGHEVVATGVYRFLRHPLHLSLAVEGSGLVLLSPSIVGCSVLLAVVVVAMRRNLREEQLLLESLGSDYAAYLESSAWDLVDLLPRTWRSLKRRSAPVA